MGKSWVGDRDNTVRRGEEGGMQESEGRDEMLWVSEWKHELMDARRGQRA